MPRGVWTGDVNFGLVSIPVTLHSAESYKDIKQAGINEKEVKMAEQLIASLTEKWDRFKYQDDYRSSFLDYAMEKVRMGETTELKEKTGEEEPTSSTNGVIELVSLLKKSLPKKELASSSSQKNYSSNHKKLKKAG